jgi:ATP-binding cassette subfamily B protein
MKLKLFTRADTATIKQTLRIYREELSGEKRPFIISLIFTPLQDLFLAVLFPLLVSFFTQSLITNPHNIATPLWLLAGMVVMALCSVASSHIGYITMFNHQERMTTKLTERALSGLLAHSHTFFANSKVGSLAGDVNTFSRSYLAATDAFAFQAKGVLINFIASLVVIAFIAPLMLPVLLILTASIVIDSLHSYTQRSVYRNKRKEMTSKLFGNIADILGNQTLVRMFGRGDQEIATVVDERRAIEGVASKEIEILQFGAERRMGLLFAFQIITLLLCLFLAARGLVSIAALIFIITYLGRLTTSMFQINSLIRSLEQAFLDAAKVTEILNKAPEITDAPDAKRLVVHRGEITLDHVSFRYADAKHDHVFNDLSLAIPAGQSIGLVGKSGGGKSTLTQLLLRYMDIQDGNICIDKQNIAEVTQNSLRDAIAYVPQDPYLFHRSLRENIAYGNPGANDEEIIAAAKKANAMEFIADLPNGLDTIVGERGVKLSGGQRQRIAIARAILKDAPILLLDEATSALDSESEKYIQSALENLMKNRTSIVIAHRLSTIAKLDRIIVLEKGAIVEDGSHHELQHAGGIYETLWTHQSGGFIEE